MIFGKMKLERLSLGFTSTKNENEYLNQEETREKREKSWIAQYFAEESRHIGNLWDKIGCVETNSNERATDGTGNRKHRWWVWVT